MIAHEQVRDQPLTAEQYGRLEDDGPPNELVAGKIVERAFGSLVYGCVCTNVICQLSEAEDRFQNGTATARIGVITTRNPDTVRGVDAAYFRSDRVPPNGLGDEYLDTPPNVVFEVLDKLGRRVDRQSVVHEYLKAGVETVCLVDHRTTTLLVWDAVGPRCEQLYHEKENLRLPAIHSECEFSVAEFFD